MRTSEHFFVIYAEICYSVSTLLRESASAFTGKIKYMCGWFQPNILPPKGLYLIFCAQRRKIWRKQNYSGIRETASVSIS